MDLSDIHGSGAGATPDERDDDERWPALLGQVGSEVSGPLTAAIERVNELATTGRIDRQALRALRSELDEARRAAMAAQLLARYGSGRVRQSHERIELSQVLREATTQRGREADARGVPLRQVLKPAEVIVDPALLFALVQATLDWALALARSPIDLRLEIKPWPVHARLSCRFLHRPADRVDDASAPHVAIDTLSWRMVEQVAWSMGVIVERRVGAGETLLALEFPRTVNEQIAGLSTIELDHGFASSQNSKPLAGHHVLVVAPRRELRTRVREAIRHMGLLLDFVASIDEAREFCRDGLPHAIVYASALSGGRLDAWRAEVRRDVQDFVFIEIAEQAGTFEAGARDGAPTARVGLDTLEDSLPSALVFELSKGP